MTDNVEVVQAQETLTSAELDVINSVFAHNVAKLSLARSIASAADSLPAVPEPSIAVPLLVGPVDLFLETSDPKGNKVKNSRTVRHP